MVYSSAEKINNHLCVQYMRSLGVEEKWQFVDVFGLDEELLALVARPVLAVMLLYPLSEQVSVIGGPTCTGCSFSVPTIGSGCYCC